MRLILLCATKISFALGVGLGVAAQAAEIRCQCAEAIRPILAELGPRFEEATGHKLIASYELAPVVKRQIEAGQPFEIAILNPPQVEDLVKQGKIASDTRANLGRAALGLAIRAGAAKPDLSSVDAFKRTLLEAKSVVYPEQGTSGAAFLAVLDRLGIADVMKPKLKPVGAGASFPIVAKGEADMMVTVIPQILANQRVGIELAGPLPQELQSWIALAAGIGVHAREAEAAKALIAFLTTPAALSVMKAKGWEPIP